MVGPLGSGGEAEGGPRPQTPDSPWSDLRLRWSSSVSPASPAQDTDDRATAAPAQVAPVPAAVEPRLEGREVAEEATLFPSPPQATAGSSPGAGPSSYHRLFSPLALQSPLSQPLRPDCLRLRQRQRHRHLPHSVISAPATTASASRLATAGAALGTSPFRNE